MFNFKPKEDIFFTLLVKLAKQAYNVSVHLNNFAQDPCNVDEMINNISEAEKEGHALKHDIVKRLQETFITPFDREDIYLIMRNIDVYINNIRSAIYRFKMYHINEVHEPAKEIIQCLVESTEQLISLIENLQYKDKTSVVKECIKKIDYTEGKVDDLYRNAITGLFDNPENVLEVLKWKELYQHLENTADQCEEIADSIEVILTKNE